MSTPRSSGSELLPLDFRARGRRIDPCRHCATWWAEAVTDRRGTLIIRKWHTPDCPVLLGASVPLQTNAELRAALADVVAAAEHLTSSGRTSRATEMAHDAPELNLTDVLARVSGTGEGWDDVEVVLQRIWHAVAEAMDLDFYVHYVLEPDGHEMRLISSSGIGARDRTTLGRLGVGEAICGAVAATGTMRACSNVHDSTACRQGVLLRRTPRTFSGGSGGY